MPQEIAIIGKFDALVDSDKLRKNRFKTVANNIYDL